MVVEHTFVTTLPPQEALKKASQFLARGGFVAKSQTAFALDQTAWTTIDVRRGKTTSTKSSAIPDLPQQIRLEWDRGRVSVAASIADRHSVKKRSALLLSIVIGLENLLAKGQSEDQAVGEWYRIDSELRRSGRWYKYRRWLLAVLVAGVWIGIVILITLSRR